MLPPLIKGYIRLGAKVCGPPALDADFGVADFFVAAGPAERRRAVPEVLPRGPGMSHAWMPASPCGDGCLTDGDPVVGFPRRVLRFAAAILVVLAALLSAPCCWCCVAAGSAWSG